MGGELGAEGLHSMDLVPSWWGNPLHSCVEDLWRVLHSEALSFAVDVAQTQIHISADALHRLYRQGASQVLSVGPRRRQAEPEPMHGAGLISTVGDVVEQVAHAGVLCALLSRAEVVVHHLVHYVVRDAASTV